MLTGESKPEQTEDCSTAPTLVLKDGPLAGRRVSVESELVVGRVDADLNLDDPQLSRQHAVIRRHSDELVVEDLGSLNGTWVNDRRIELATPLAAGDILRLGETRIEVEGIEPARTRTRTAIRPENVVPTRAAPAELPAFVAPAATPSLGRRPAPATRRVSATILSFGVVVATAAVLILYFAQR